TRVSNCSVPRNRRRFGTLRSERRSCSWQRFHGRGVEAVIAHQLTRIVRLSTGGRQIVLHSLANALDVLRQAGIVEAIAFVWFRGPGYLSSRRKAVNSVELLLN